MSRKCGKWKRGRKGGMRVLIKNPSLLQLKDQVRMKRRINERKGGKIEEEKDS